MKEFLMSDKLTDVILTAFSLSVLLFVTTALIVLVTIFINEFKDDLDSTKVKMSGVSLRKTFFGELCYMSCQFAMFDIFLFGVLSMIRLGIS